MVTDTGENDTTAVPILGFSMVLRNVERRFTARTSFDEVVKRKSWRKGALIRVPGDPA